MKLFGLLAVALVALQAHLVHSTLLGFLYNAPSSLFFCPSYFSWLCGAASRSTTAGSAASDRATTCKDCTRSARSGAKIHPAEARFGFPIFPTTAAPVTQNPNLPCCEGPNVAKLVNATDCGIKGPTRIIGGTSTVKGEFPWMVGLLDSAGNYGGCAGGALLSCDPVVVVNAAHCFQGSSAKPNGRKLAFGSWKIGSNDSPDEIRLPISEIVNHPSYNSQTNENDIAVVKVSGSLTCIKQTIWPACLPTVGETYAGWNGFVTGWGTQVSGDSSTLSDTLLKVNVPVVSDSVCQTAEEVDGTVIKDSMICAGGVKGKDSCQGDSGGPLVAQNGNTVGYSHIGVVSFGSGCALDGRYGVYSEVSKYLPWIASTHNLGI